MTAGILRARLMIYIGSLMEPLLFAISAHAAGGLIHEMADTPQAPAFNLENMDGGRMTPGDFAGKVVAVNFWATWCPPCRAEMPSMQRVHDEYRDMGFVVVAINVGEDWDRVAPFTNKHDLSFPVLFDKDGAVTKKWGALGLPTTFILDRKGRITHRINGGRDWDSKQFRDELEAIIKAAE